MRCMWLRSPYTSCLEPTLESCMKIQRKSALTMLRWMHMHQLGWYRRAFGPFTGMEGSFYFLDALLSQHYLFLDGC